MLRPATGTLAARVSGGQAETILAIFLTSVLERKHVRLGELNYDLTAWVLELRRIISSAASFLDRGRGFSEITISYSEICVQLPRKQ